jgi:hypothetical protein
MACSGAGAIRPGELTPFRGLVAKLEGAIAFLDALMAMSLAYQQLT